MQRLPQSQVSWYQPYSYQPHKVMGVRDLLQQAWSGSYGTHSGPQGHKGQLWPAAGKDATAAATLPQQIAWTIYASLASTVLLLAVKTLAYGISGSLAVLANAMDSLIDLASQAIVSLADQSMSRKDPKYPAGKARLEPISVLGCAFIMCIAALLVFQGSATQLAATMQTGVLPTLELGTTLFVVLSLGTAIKLALWWHCTQLKQYSGAAEALAEDAINEVAANITALVTATLAARFPLHLWWADPVGGLLIAGFIFWRWTRITHSSIAKVVGVTAPPDTLDALAAVASAHHPSTCVGFIRAYHCGQRLAVDCELEGPKGWSISEAAIICRELKEKLEAVPEVEAASVIVVPTGSHSSCSQPTLLLPATVCKPPGAADVAERAEAGGLGRLGSSTSWGQSSEWDLEAGRGLSKRSSTASMHSIMSGPFGSTTQHYRSMSDEAFSPTAPLQGPATLDLARTGSYAEQVAWRRALRDQPHRGLRSASFRHRQASLLLMDMRSLSLSLSPDNSLLPDG